MSPGPGNSRKPPLAPGGLLIRVRGRVQGVGFRPFVKRLAEAVGLAGRVWNHPEGVEIEVEGPSMELQTFLARLSAEPPLLAQIDSLASESVPGQGLRGFSIGPSESGPSATLPPPDAATCDACRHEICDPQDRRHRYPFTTCVDCGPRYTIMRSLPYDRPYTTMADFEMCAECRAEYEDPAGRRLHAQTNACPVCGPQLIWFSAAEADSFLAELRGPVPDEPLPGVPAPAPPKLAEGPLPEWITGEAALQQALRGLRRGQILAIKGIGGYHLACDATSPTAVAKLRRRKGRDGKPFALMARSLEEVQRYAVVSPHEERLLQSSERPIVLLERREKLDPSPFEGDAAPGSRPAEPGELADGVAPGSPDLGFFLPYSPLHHLLMDGLAAPLVLTSGNLSDEPIAYQDRDAVHRLRRVADGFLLHDRSIEHPADDSVVRVFRQKPYPVRRSRGYVPNPVPFRGADLPLLAVGAHQKNSFCLTRGARAFLSVHHGDLDHPEAFQAFERSIGGLTRLLGIDPRMIVHDLHPDYGSTRLAVKLGERLGLPLAGVQHHQAHVASVLAESRHASKAVGIAYDGTGYGTDGTIWGGEFFVGEAADLNRRAHWEQFPLPGGELAARQLWRSALGLLVTVAGNLQEDDDWTAGRLAALPAAQAWGALPWRPLARAARHGLASPMTSSVGRMFDGVAALLGVRHQASFEAEGAILLEGLARTHFRGGLPSAAAPPPWSGQASEGVPKPASPKASEANPPAGPQPVSPLALPLRPLLTGLFEDLNAGLGVAAMAGRFHHQLAWTTADVAGSLAEQAGTDTVALGGGVFQNLVLLELTVRFLEGKGLRVLVHREVPTNDGGLSLGQAEIAAARLA